MPYGDVDRVARLVPGMPNMTLDRAMQENQEIQKGANIIRGKVTFRGVADAFGLKFTPVDTLL